MSSSTNSKSPLREFFEVIGAVLGIPLVLFTIVNNISEQPLIALIVTLITAVLLSVWLYFRGISFTYIIIAWLSLTVIILLAFVIWPKTMTLEGYVNDSSGNPIAYEIVNFFDYTGRIYETKTNQSGFYQFVDVPTGKYRIRVRATEIQGETKGLLVRVVSQSISVDKTSPPLPTTVPTGAVMSTTIAAAPTEIRISSTNTPTPELSSDKSTNTPMPTMPPISRGTVLLEEDFEDGIADGWKVSGGKWEIIKDETGNHVYSGTGWGYTVAGNKNWKNYVLEAKIKGIAPTDLSSINTEAWAMLLARVNSGPICSGYGVQIGYSDWVTFGKMGDECHTTFPNGYFLEPQMGKWYRVRYEAFATTHSIYIDDRLVLQYQDSQLEQGYIGLMVGTNTIVYFDDIRVTELLP